jgi:hypothetical protein
METTHTTAADHVEEIMTEVASSVGALDALRAARGIDRRALGLAVDHLETAALWLREVVEIAQEG